MPISGPVPEWLLSAVAAATLFTVMFDIGLAIVLAEFRVFDHEALVMAGGKDAADGVAESKLFRSGELRGP